MDRIYELDEANKCFIVKARTEEIYKLEDLQRVEKNLKEGLESHEYNKKILESSLAKMKKVPNKEKLIRHRKEHFMINDLEKLEKFEQDLKFTNSNIEQIKKDLEEVIEHRKILEDLVDKNTDS